jgi:K+ transporter
LLGVVHIGDDLEIFYFFNPLYGVRMLIVQPGLALLVFGGVWRSPAVAFTPTWAISEKSIRFACLRCLSRSVLNYLSQAFIIAILNT